MNKINQIGYGQLPAVSKTQAVARSSPKTDSPSPVESGGGDRVEISERAQLLSRISELPEIRQEKVDEIRQQLSNGTYDYKGKLSDALDTMMQEYRWE